MSNIKQIIIEDIMGEMDFISFLNEIKNEEYTYRDIEKVERENGQVFYTGPDIIKPAYAVEYDYVPAVQTEHSLMSKDIKGLFCMAEK